jgi:hypothetical protein
MNTVRQRLASKPTAAVKFNSSLSSSLSKYPYDKYPYDKYPYDKYPYDGF